MANGATTGTPSLWSDWCAVVGVPVDQTDEDTLARFSHQANPPATVLAQLRPVVKTPRATAWAATMTSDQTLQMLLRAGSLRIADPMTYWITRLQLQRLLFLAVLVAPRSLGGLGFTRSQIHDLTPQALSDLRREVGRTDDPSTCAACVIWTWLEVLSTNNGWSHAAVRSLAHHPRRVTDGQHHHEQPDPSCDWLDCLGMLPSIDRWGYLDPYGTLHPSSISGLMHELSALSHLRAPANQVTDPDLNTDRVTTVRSFSLQEQERVFARADELNARIARIPDECG